MAMLSLFNDIMLETCLPGIPAMYVLQRKQQLQSPVNDLNFGKFLLRLFVLINLVTKISSLQHDMFKHVHSSSNTQTLHPVVGIVEARSLSLLRSDINSGFYPPQIRNQNWAQSPPSFGLRFPPPNF